MVIFRGHGQQRVSPRPPHGSAAFHGDFTAVNERLESARGSGCTQASTSPSIRGRVTGRRRYTASGRRGSERRRPPIQVRAQSFSIKFLYAITTQKSKIQKRSERIQKSKNSLKAASSVSSPIFWILWPKIFRS